MVDEIEFMHMDCDEDREADEEAFDLCSQLPDGSCPAAGSEYCDFECPFRD